VNSRTGFTPLNTALYYLADHGKVLEQIVDYLLNHGANPMSDLQPNGSYSAYAQARSQNLQWFVNRIKETCFPTAVSLRLIWPIDDIEVKYFHVCKSNFNYGDVSWKDLATISVRDQGMASVSNPIPIERGGDGWPMDFEVSIKGGKYELCLPQRIPISNLASQKRCFFSLNDKQVRVLTPGYYDNHELNLAGIEVISEFPKSDQLRYQISYDPIYTKLISGGDGKSRDTAIILNDADIDPENGTRGIYAVYAYLEKLYGKEGIAWTEIGREDFGLQNHISHSPEKYIQKYNLKLSTGELAHLYVDATYLVRRMRD